MSSPILMNEMTKRLERNTTRPKQPELEKRERITKHNCTSKVTYKTRRDLFSYNISLIGATKMTNEETTVLEENLKN